MTTFIYVDRRQAAKGKSSNNRQKLLRRVRDSIRNAKPDDLIGKTLGSTATSAGGNINPVRVARDRLEEPNFAYDFSTGNRDIVVVGNDTWEKGDDFPLSGPEEGEGGDGEGSGGPTGENTEDDFIVNISRQEFFDVFFDDCVLPNLEDNHQKELPKYITKPAGFQPTGNPAQLAIARSYKLSKARQLALTSTSRARLAHLLEQRNALVTQLNDWLGDTNDTTFVALSAEVELMDAEIEALRTKISCVLPFEKVDLRYRKRDKVVVKSADAVFIMIMDVSGSMGELEKRLARKFFSLQYAFIVKKYPQTDLIFIAHTDTAFELTEEEFFSTSVSGSTVISPSYDLALKLIGERYDSALTNIYLSQASDGDNWAPDNMVMNERLLAGGLLGKLRHMVYCQVGHPHAFSYMSGTNGVWNTLTNVAGESGKIDLVRIGDDSEIYTAFKQVYSVSDT